MTAIDVTLAEVTRRERLAAAYPVLPPAHMAAGDPVDPGRGYQPQHLRRTPDA